jgi:hypothetical protein
MAKDYKIKTIKQVLEVVNSSNVENFKRDFCSWLDYKLALFEAIKEAKKTKMMENVEKIEVDLDTFHWVDDGKNDANITFKIINK